MFVGHLFKFGIYSSQNEVFGLRSSSREEQEKKRKREEKKGEVFICEFWAGELLTVYVTFNSELLYVSLKKKNNFGS